MSIEAIKQALEYIKATNKSSSFWLVPESNLNKTVNALTVAIEQAERQEPVAWANKDDLEKFDMRVRTNCDHYHTVPLYAAPPQRQPLTDEQVMALLPSPDGSAEADVVKVEVSPGIWGTEYSEIDAWSQPLVMQVARAIEAAHGITGDSK